MKSSSALKLSQILNSAPARLWRSASGIFLIMATTQISVGDPTGVIYFNDFQALEVVEPAVDPAEKKDVRALLQGKDESSPLSSVFFERRQSDWISIQPEWRHWIVSWNLIQPDFIAEPSDFVEVRLQFGYGDQDGDTLWSWGRWSVDPGSPVKGSIGRLENEWGRLDTDTLSLKRPADRVRVVVLRCSSGPTSLPDLKNLFLAWSSAAPPSVIKQDESEYKKILPLDVQPRSQLYFPEGSGWCSPTSTAMVLDYWASQRKNPVLHFETPVAARQVWDPTYRGTGNWPFNTAFAGSQPGMQAFVGRLSGLAALQDWLELGIPVVVSVDYSIVLENGEAPSGHLMVCVGMDPDGAVWLNDPGTRYQLRRRVEKETFLRAWAHSGRAGYFIYPENTEIPQGYLQLWKP